MKILVRLLPGETSEADVRELFAPHGEIKVLKLARGGSEERVTAVVEMDVSRVQADVIAQAIDRTSWKGHRVEAHVPLFQGGD